ncbi:MAG: Ig-like domain-containing protein, partial [Pirellulaceae bacterium]
MSLRRKTKPVLSSKDRQFIKKKVAARLSLETLEKRELLAADLVGGLADLAEGEGDPKVQMRLVATDLQGQPLDTLYINQAFHLNGYVKDLRADAKGAFTSYMDIDFHKGLVEAIGTISHAEPYNNFKSGSVDVSGSLGVIDEVGGMAGLTELGGDERLVFTVPMRAIGAGTVVFDGNAADTLPAHQVLVYGENDEVPPSLITFADLSLEISDLGSLPYSEDFNDGSADAMTVTQGSFEIQQNRYQSTPANAQDTAITVIDLTADIPSKTRFQSTINLEYANNRRRNAHLVFAYQDADNYKFAGLNAESRRWVISEVVDGQTRELRRSNVNPTQNKNYQLELVIDGSQATLSVDGVTKVANTFSGNLNVGKFGLLADGANSRFDNVHISEIFPVPLSEQDVAETVKGQSITINVLANDSHEQDGAALHIVSVEGVDNATVELQDNNSDNKADVLVFTPDSDFTGSEIFTYVVGDSNGQTDSADVLVDVLPGIPLEENFSSESPAGFEVVTGNWRVENGAYVAQNRGGLSLAKIRTGAVNPTETEFSATISMPRVSGYNSNVELVFDYVDGDNYKFVGGSVDSRMWYLGKVSNGQRSVTQTVTAEIGRQEYELAVVIRGKSLTFEVGEETVLSHDYEVAPNAGLFGLAANRAKPVVDDIRIREFVPAPVAEDDAVQTVVNTPVDIAVLGNDGHETDGTFIYIESVSSVENGTAELKDTNDDGKNDTITFTPATDYRGTTSLEYVVRDNDGQTDRGAVSITVAAALPLEVDFNDGTAVDFSYTSNKWRFNGGGFQSTDTR